MHVDSLMLKVLIAMLPGIFVYYLYAGLGVIENIATVLLASLIFEAVSLFVRHRPILPALADLSAVVTALLLALAIPPGAPVWLAFTGSFFAIVVAKQLYGGLGYNPFNPAMVGFAVLLISFPQFMTSWQSLDAHSGATILDSTSTARKALQELDLSQTNMGLFGAAGYEWVSAFFAIGGLWLYHSGVISWRIPLSFLAGLLIPACVAWLIDSQFFLSPLVHLFSGATLLGAFFIATDPVSAATSPKGRLIYGFGIGLLIWLIRSFGGYPDGVAFAVLLMNIAAPSIDYMLRPQAHSVSMGKKP